MRKGDLGMKKRVIAVLLSLTMAFTPAWTVFATEGGDNNATPTPVVTVTSAPDKEDATPTPEPTEEDDKTEDKTEIVVSPTPAVTTTPAPASSPTATPTPNPKASITPVAPSTPKDTPTPSATPTVTSTSTITATPTPIVTPTPTPTPTVAPEPEAKTAYSHTETVDGYTVDLKAAEGVFPEGTNVKIARVSEIREKQIENIVSHKIDDDKSISKVVVFDITFFDKDGNKIEPEDGKVDVSIKLDQELKEAVKESDSSEVQVFHIDENSRAQKVDCDTTAENVSFAAEEFTEYAIIVTDGVIHGPCGTNVEWSLTPEGILTISGTGAMDDFVSTNKRPWAAYDENVKSIVIENGITHIGSNAFGGYGNLKCNVTIPDSVTSIGARAFYNNKEDTRGFEGSLVLSKSLQSIGNDAFYGNSKLTGKLELPSTLKTIGSGAFAYCSGLTGSLVIPSGVTTIGVASSGYTSGAFQSCTGLTGSLVIPDTVTEIGYNSFDYCTGLTGSLNIPASVKKIGSCAFYGCSGFTGDITIPEGVEVIGMAAFHDMTGITGTITIPASLKTGSEMFIGYVNPIYNVKKIINRSNVEIPLPQCLMSDLIKPNGSGYSLEVCKDGYIYLNNTMTSQLGRAWNTYYSNVIKDHTLDEITAIVGSSVSKAHFDYWINNSSSQYAITSISNGIALKSGRVQVTYLVNGAEYCNQLVAVGKAISAPQEPIVSGYRFDGWYLGDTKWDFDNYVTGKMSLVAKLTSVSSGGGNSDKDKENDSSDSSDYDSNSGSNSVTSLGTSTVITLPTPQNGNITVIDSRPAITAESLPGHPNTGNANGVVGENTTNDESSDSLEDMINDTKLLASMAPSMEEIVVDTDSETPEQIAAKVEEAPEKSTVVLEMKSNVTIDKEILESAKGKDVDIVLDMGDYKWTINGQNITADTLQSINMEVKFGSNAIPADKIDKLAGDNARKTISLTHEGDFGFAATLTINVGAENFGKYANLYYFNEHDDDLEFICSDMVRANGDVDLMFTHASEYVAIFSDEMMEPLPTSDALQQAQSGGGFNFFSLYAIIGIIVLTGVGVMLYVNKKKNEMF